MEMYIQRGENRMDCEMKIAERYKRPFKIHTIRDISMGGFLGLFSRPGVEVGFSFYPVPLKSQGAQVYTAREPASWNVSDQGRQYTAEQYSRNTAVNLEEEKRKVIAAAGKSYDNIISTKEATETFQAILESMNEIKDKIETGGQREEHPAFKSAAEALKLNDFSEKYIKNMMDRMKKELPLETLENDEAVKEHLLEWIGETINIYKDDSAQRARQQTYTPQTHKPRIIVLVGPTGVGKTTTITKLAAIFGIGTDEIPAINVRLITIDAFRIGAREHLEKYGDIMQIPVSFIDGETTYDGKMALRKEIAIYSHETDLFLIDTIGKSPKDAAKLGEMKEILEGCGRGTEVHLVLCAGTKTSDIEDIMRQFEPFGYRSVVLTKMDETYRIGNVISALAEKGKSVSYITDGQKVPDDIKKASVVRFLVNLDGFKVNREKLEKRFPSGEAEQFKWR